MGLGSAETMHRACRIFRSDFSGVRDGWGGKPCRGRQLLPAENEKGPARGEGEAFGSSAGADDRQRAAREEDGRNLFPPHMRGWTESDNRQIDSAAMRFRGGQKKGSIRRWSLMKVGQTDEGGGNAVCLWALPREEDSAQTRVAKRVDRGRRFDRTSQRQWEYAGGEPFPQWKGLHHSHALCAGKVSLFDPIVTKLLHSSRRHSADSGQKYLKLIKSLRGVPQNKRPRPRGGQGLIEGGEPPARKRAGEEGEMPAPSAAV